MTKRVKYLITGTGPSAVLAAYMLHRKESRSSSGSNADFLIVGPKPDFSNLDESLIPFYIWLNKETYDIFKELSDKDDIDRISIEEANIGVYWRGALTVDRTKEMMESYQKKTGKDYMSGGRKSFRYIKTVYSEAFQSMFDKVSDRFQDSMIKSIDMEAGYAELESGDDVVYDSMLNSISLDAFLSMQSHLSVAVGDLPCGNICVLSVSAEEVEIEELMEIDWDKNVYVYFPEEGYPWYRVSMKKMSTGDNRYLFEFINTIPESSPLLSNFISDKNMSMVNKGVITTLKPELVDSFANYFNVHHISRYSRWCSGWKISDAARYMADRDFKIL